MDLSGAASQRRPSERGQRHPAPLLPQGSQSVQPWPCSKPLVHLAPSPCHRGIVQDYRSAPPFGERICTIPTSVISSIKISQGAFHQCVQVKVQVGTSE